MPMGMGVAIALPVRRDARRRYLHRERAVGEENAVRCYQKVTPL